MATIVKDEKRRLIPRWRYVHDAQPSDGFCSLPSSKSKFTPNTKYLDEKLSDWKTNQSISTAAEVVSCAVTIDKIDDAQECAKYILKNKDKTTAYVTKLAEQCLGLVNIGQGSRKCTIDTLKDNLTNDAREHIKDAKRKLFENPRNVIARLDMARAEAILGNDRKALDQMDIALKLDPNHRNILRAASRLFIHLGEKEKAHQIIATNPGTKHDPWLMSVEISTANIADRSPRYLKNARRYIESTSAHPIHMVELCASIGTIDFLDGNKKNARKNLRKSFSVSTENVLAQARWLSAQNLSVDIPEMAWELPLSYEAHCWKMLQNQNWEQASEYCKKWLCDEPFSSRPARVGSCLGLSVLGDLQYAEVWARIGLMSDPDDNTLLNNLTVCLAYQNRIEEAIDAFKRIGMSDDEGLPTYVKIATAGLLNFRFGHHDIGRKLYQKAEELAPKEFKTLVIFHWANEERTADTPYAKRMLEEAHKLNGIAKDPYVKKCYEIIVRNDQLITKSYTSLEQQFINSGILPHKNLLLNSD